MSKLLPLCFLSCLTIGFFGCGDAGSDTPSEESNQAAQELENSPDYEKEMMGESGEGK